MSLYYGLEADSYDRQYSDSYLFRRILSYVATYKPHLLTIVVMVLIVASMNALRPILIAVGVEALEDEGDFFSLLVAALLLSAVTEYFSNWLRHRMFNRVIAGIVNQMRKDAFAAAVHRDLAFYDDHKTGKVVSRISSDTQEFADIVQIASVLISQLVAVLFILIALIDRSPLLTGVLLVMAPTIMMAALAFRQVARRVTRQGARAMAIFNDKIQETVAGISVAKNFRKEAAIYDEFVAVNTQSYRINLQRGLVLSMLFPIVQALVGVAIGAIVFVGARLVISGAITIGAWFLFVQGVDRFWFPFMNLSAFWSQFQQGLSATERVFALIDAENTIVQSEWEPADSLEGRIEFDNVTFEYRPGQPILTNFNLSIEPGTTLAFVGHTGAGKSTIAKLITRFYEFQDGQIRIDGRDIRSFDLQSFREQLGIVSQQPFLFSGTVMDNIRYSKPDATDTEIEEIAYTIGDGEWLETLPDGLHSDVGERGARLSMGQRQLVSLLRVLLQRPTVFILDEATASVDPFTEMQIKEALDLILEYSTSILIAHRLSTVRSADRIIVLRDGEIIEEGNHDFLLARDGHYAELYNTYFRHQSLSYIENAREMFTRTVGAD
jgi:ATP-binding cassette subfamily B protein